MGAPWDAARLQIGQIISVEEPEITLTQGR